MIRNSKKTKKKTKQSKWIPVAAQAFLARRIQDGLALTLVGTGLFLCGALLTYKMSDPSRNTSVSADMPIHNVFGSSGSHTADLLLQTFGLASFVIALAAIIWGVKFWKRAPLSPMWLRITALISALLFGAIAFSRIPSSDWLPQAYSGGSGGGQILNSLADTLNFALGGWTHTLIALISAMLALGALTLTLPITRAQWKTAFSFTRAVITSATVFVLKASFQFVDWIKHHNDASYMPPTRPTLEKAAKAKQVKAITPQPAQKPVTPPIPAQQVEKAIKVISPKATPTKATPTSQGNLSLGDEEWEFPSVDILDETPKNQDGHIDEEALKRNAELLQNVLEDYNVQGQITSILPGPVVTLYEFEPAPGTNHLALLA